MGIKGLNKLISQYAPSAITQQHINEFVGSKIAIDSEILIHKFRTNEKNSHIFGFINNIFWYLENGIIPIYIFDGIPNIAKQTNILTKRGSYKEQMHRKVEELENKFVEQLDNIKDTSSSGDSIILGPEINDTLDQLFKIQRKITFMTVTKNHRNECKYLLKLMGIPFLVANEDAEAFCVALQKRKIVDYVYTEDTDVIPYFIATFTNNDINNDIKILRKGDTDNNEIVTVINISQILKEIDLSPASFIDMCILCGCDFCTTIPKIGPIKAYNYVKKYDNIDNIIKCMDVIIPDDFKYQEARNIFFKDHFQTIEKSLDLGPLNSEDLKTYLFQERSLNPLPIIEKYNKILSIFIQINQSSSNILPSSSKEGFDSSVSINKNAGS